MNAKGDSEKKKARLEAEESAPANAGTEREPSEAAEAEVAAAEEAVSAELKKLAAEKHDLTNSLIRLQADFDNYRKRVERERQMERQRGAETVIERLLPVLDGFDRAILAHGDAAYEEYRKGFELIRKQLYDTLAKQGLERIETEGQPFNPHVHHAIERVETEGHKDGTVLEELQAGYSFHGRVLRPAMVRVAANSADESEESKSRVN